MECPVEAGNKRTRGESKFGRCSKTLRSSWRGHYPKSGFIKCPTECVHLETKQGCQLDRFVSSYLPQNSEIKDWHKNVCYSINKNKRWELSSRVEQVFCDSAEELASEDFEISIADLHCHNGRFKALFRNHGDTFTFFDRKTNKERIVADGPPDEVQVKRASSKVNGRFRVERSQDTAVCIDLFRENGELQRYSGDRRVLRDHACDIYLRRNVEDNGAPKSRKKRSFFPEPGRWRRIRKAFVEGEGEAFQDEPDMLDDIHQMEDVFESLSTERSLCLLDYIRPKSQVRKRRRKQRAQNSEESDSGKKGKIIYTPLAGSIEPDAPEEQDEEFEMIDPDDIHVFPVQLESLDEVAGWRMETGKGFPRTSKLDHISGDVTILLRQQPAQDTFLLQAHFKSNPTKEEDLAETLLPQSSRLWRLSELAGTILLLGTCPTSTLVAREVVAMEGYHVVSPEVSLQMLQLAQDQGEAKKSRRMLENTRMGCFEECGICLSVSSLHRDTCGHTFCRPCWRRWLASPQGSSASCPAHLCQARLDTVDLAWLAGRKLAATVQSKWVADLLATHPLLTSCPKPGCDRLALLDHSHIRSVRCACAQSYCPSCKSKPHQPASCSEMNQYRGFAKEMAAFNSLEHTVEVRPCPKCNTGWEKSYGCNHMSCTCGTHFCWGCGGEHQGGAGGGFCSRITKPLEKVSIVPLPTEKFPLARIELFQHFMAVNKRPMSSKEAERVVSRALVNQDRRNYLLWLLGNVDKTNEAKMLEQETREAMEEFNVCCQLFPHALLVWPTSPNFRRVLRSGLANLAELREIFSAKEKRSDEKAAVNRGVQNLRRVRLAVKRVCSK